MKNTFSTLRNLSRFPLAIAIIVGLAACAKKPPGCGDAETLDLAKSMIIKESRNSNVSMKLMDNLPTLDPDGTVVKFMQSAIDVSMITSDGYDSTAKRHSCHARISRKDAPASPVADITYTTQSTEDADGTWVLTLANYQGYAHILGMDARNRWAQMKYADSWNGTYACGGVDGETSGPRGPFSMPVSAVIDKDISIKLERTTAGGGFETLSGDVNPETGVVRLAGTGENSPDDKWRARYQGSVADNTLNASGGISPNGSTTLLRSCTVTLKRGGAVAAK